MRSHFRDRRGQLGLRLGTAGWALEALSCSRPFWSEKDAEIAAAGQSKERVRDDWNHVVAAQQTDRQAVEGLLLVCVLACVLLVEAGGDGVDLMLQSARDSRAMAGFSSSWQKSHWTMRQDGKHLAALLSLYGVLLVV